MGHCDVLRSGHPAEATGLWHIGVIPEHSAAFRLPPSDFSIANSRFSCANFLFLQLKNPKHPEICSTHHAPGRRVSA